MYRFIYIFVIIYYSVSAQSNRFYYDLKFRPDSSRTFEEQEYFIVDVNPQSVKFYSLIDFRNDSIMRVKNPEAEYLHTKFYNYISRKNNSFDNMRYFITGNAVAMMKTHDEMKWKILPNIKMLGTIKVQAASTHFGGRTWMAWFADSIPIPEGPYKFRGLPGMILELYDNNNYYHFTFIKNEKLSKEYDTSRIIETHFGEKPVLLSKEKYIKLKQEEYENPFAQMINDGVKTYFDESGNELPFDFRQMIIERRQELKSINNHIEKEYILKYPNK